MVELAGIQKDILQNKIKHGFNVTDVGKEIILMTEELGELARAFKKSNGKPAKDINNREEIIDALGDLMIYCLGLFEMLQVDGEAVLQSIIKNNESRSHNGWIRDT